MATEFGEIYRLFLGSIDDYELAEVLEDELDEILLNHLMKGMVYLQVHMYDVSDYDADALEFARDLTHVEKVMLSKAMKLEWVGERLYSADLMRRSIGDRDYKAVQGTDLIKQLSALHSKLETEIQRLLIDYSYTNEDKLGDLW